MFHILWQMCLLAKYGSCWMNISPPTQSHWGHCWSHLLFPPLFYMVCITNIAYHWLYCSCVLLFAGLSFPECKLCEGRCLCFFCWLMCPSHLQTHFFLPQITLLFLMKQYRFKTLFLIREELKCWPWSAFSYDRAMRTMNFSHLGAFGTGQPFWTCPCGVQSTEWEGWLCKCPRLHISLVCWLWSRNWVDKRGKMLSDFHHPDPKLFKFVDINLISSTSADTRVLSCFLPYIFPALTSRDSCWPACDKTPK